MKGISHQCFLCLQGWVRQFPRIFLQCWWLIARHKSFLRPCWKTRFNPMAGHMPSCCLVIYLTLLVFWKKGQTQPGCLFAMCVRRRLAKVESYRDTQAWCVAWSAFLVAFGALAFGMDNWLLEWDTGFKVQIIAWILLEWIWMVKHDRKRK